MAHQPVAQRPTMPDYGVPESTEGLLPWSWAEDRLLHNRNFWVVTASASGRPHAMPVWGVWLPGTARFWFSCGSRSRKALNLTSNPQVTITTSDTVEVVVVEGRAHPRADGPDRADVLHAYAYKYESGHKAEELLEFCGAAVNTVFEVTPLRAFSVIEREDEFATRATRWVW